MLVALGVDKYFSDTKLSREHCIILPNNSAIKNIAITGAQTDNVILVDNSICAFCLHPYNGIHIQSYDGSDKDDELLKLGKFLSAIHNTDSLQRAIYENGYKLGDVLKSYVG